MNPIYHALAVATVQLGQLDSAGGILGNITGLLKGGIQMLGAIMVVWGGVTIGINVHNGASGVGTLIGGVIVSAAALYFGTLDTSWVRG